MLRIHNRQLRTCCPPHYEQHYGQLHELSSPLRWMGQGNPVPSILFPELTFICSWRCSQFLGGKRFATDDDVTQCLDEFFASCSADFYREGIFQLVDWWNKITGANGDYLDDLCELFSFPHKLLHFPDTFFTTWYLRINEQGLFSVCASWL